MRIFSNMVQYGDGDIIQALMLLEEPYPTEEDLSTVRDRACFPTLYAAVDALAGQERLRIYTHSLRPRWDGVSHPQNHSLRGRWDGERIGAIFELVYGGVEE